MLEQLIREKAYQIWEQEGYPDGRAEAHWKLALQLVEESVSKPLDKPRKKVSAKPRFKRKI